MPRKPKAGRVSRGFTLVEMVVVLAIIVIISAIVISGQSSYNQSLILTDTAYTVAFSVRQVQSFGLASRGRDIDPGAPVNVASNVGYGARFAGTTGYLLFADVGGSPHPNQSLCPQGTSGTPEEKRGNCRYEAGTDQIIQNYTFSRGFTIQNICGRTGGSYACGLPALDVVFRRPETRATLTDSTGNTYSCAEVHVRAPTGGATRVVRVSQLGEISVGPLCP